MRVCVHTLSVCYRHSVCVVRAAEQRARDPRVAARSLRARSSQSSMERDRGRIEQLRVCAFARRVVRERDFTFAVCVVCVCSSYVTLQMVEECVGAVRWNHTFG